MVLDFVKRERTDRFRSGFGICTIRQVIGFQMADGLIAGRRPAYEQERRTEPASLVRRVVNVFGHRVRRPVGAFKRRRPVVDLNVPPQRGVADHRRDTLSFTILATMKLMFAGRSAKRRIKYGYQLVPKGMYTRTL